MQLILIVQVSIALLAGELGGLLPLGWFAGLLVLLAAPIGALTAGALLARNAHRGMDRAQRRGVELFFASNSVIGWAVALLLITAASSELPLVWEPALSAIGVSAVLMLSAIASSLLWAVTAWSVEKRLRESSMLRALDQLAPLQAMPSRGAFVLAQARAGLVPLLAPLLVPLLSSEGARALAMQWDPELVQEARLAGGVFGALLLFALVPLIVPPLLGLTRLAAGPTRDDLEALAHEAGVGVREIWVWPTQGLIANAAVMGAFPGLRCVMLSDGLLECMPREQVRAVMAHELGHVVRRHLAWMLAVILACWTIAGVAVTPVAEMLYQELAATAAPSAQESIAQAASLGREACVMVLGLLLFGFASRRFERQADTFAVQLLSVRELEASAPTQRDGSIKSTNGAIEAMVGALGTVALLNHVPAERSSWRHGSIAWRQAYLRTLVGCETGAMTIDTFVAVLRWSALVIVLAGLVVGFFPF